MKVIVELSQKDSNGSYEDYEKYYKELGYLYNKDWEAIYYYVDLPYLPQEGQRVGTKNGICIVEYSYYELEPKDDYAGTSRIVVSEE